MIKLTYIAQYDDITLYSPIYHSMHLPRVEDIIYLEDKSKRKYGFQIRQVAILPDMSEANIQILTTPIGSYAGSGYEVLVENGWKE